MQLAGASAAPAGLTGLTGLAELADPFAFLEMSTATAGAPLQLESLGAEGQGTARGDAAQHIAQRGVAGACSPLPYADVIAGAFGHHDISDVRATVGGPAAEASQALGARAYATGSTIAFAAAPDLRLAAHEAAHVVQQRAGVHLDDGMGRAGDVYELHADAVADAVVRGGSAEALLDQHAGGGRSASPSPGATQRAVIQRFDPSQTPEQAAEEARGILRALSALPPAQQDERIAGWSADWTRQFLAAISRADRSTYAAVLERVGAGRATVDGERFSTAFRGNVPPDVLSAFGGEEGTTAARLSAMFSASQRDKLLAFFSNHQIPDRLFNDGDGAGLPITAGQRVILSAHILSTGTYANQDAEQQRVEARNCGHWVSLVNAYAGVGSASAEDVRGNFDHRGDVVLHGGGAGTEMHSPSAGALPMDRFDDINAGDWLYIHNAINHSVIFSDWIDERPRSVEHNGETYRYRRAITYDQLHNGIGEGGLRHAENTVMLGDRGLSRARDGARVTIQTITRVAPPQEETVATTPDDLLPAGANLEAAAERNRLGLEQAGIPREEAISHVRRQNDALFAIVDAERAGGEDHSSRLSDSQRALLREANTATELEPLVHLNERLQRLADGIRFLEAAEARDTARSYGAESRAPEDRRAAGGYHTSSGRVSEVGGRAYDTNGEAPTTGYLERVREPLDRYPPRGPADAPRGRGRGRGRAASAEPAAPAEPVNAPAACGE